MADPAQNAHVLVVDDVEANRESLSRRLTRRGMTVDLAEDGEQALQKIAANDYALVLLDVMMPGMSGLEVLQRVRTTKTPAELPIIMATANDASEDIARAFELGANDYVTKPIDFTVAMARIHTQLEMSRAVRDVLRLQADLSVRNAELENAVEQLRRSAERTKRDLALAARIQSTYLPRDLPKDDRYFVAWRFLPCDELAGDALNVCPLGPHHVGLYVLDVTGHGIASALTAVAAARMLAPAHDPASILIHDGVPRTPADVLNDLSRRFIFNGDVGAGQFITCAYALIDIRTGDLSYAFAGHPDAIITTAAGGPRTLSGSGLPIGLGDEYQTHHDQLHAGDRLWLYSDGITEAMSPARELFGMQRLAGSLASLHATEPDVAQELLLRQIDQWTEHREADDDVSILMYEQRR